MNFIKKKSFQTEHVIFFGGLYFIALFYFIFLSSYIDIHPDESIYFNAIPVDSRKDTGLFYNAIYQIFTYFSFTNEVLQARFASVFLGSIFLLFTLLSAYQLKLDKYKIFIIYIVILFSYQSIFLFERIRPEISWWCLASVFVYLVILLEKYKSNKYFIFLLIISFLLPMNHQLSLIFCIFACGYIVLFLRIQIGITKTLLIILFFLFGIFFNFFVSGLMTTGFSLGHILNSFNSSSNGPSQSISKFFSLVFFESPLFLNDFAYNKNFYELIFGFDKKWLSHAFIQNLFWLLMFLTPFLLKGLKQKYILSFPLYCFIFFYFSGYYNPTYSAAFSIISLLLFFIAIVEKNKYVYFIAYVILIVSIFNGLSFLSTRILSHGKTNYFEVEEFLSNYLDKNNQHIFKASIPERFLPLKKNRDHQFYINFKNDLPTDLDVLIYDDYDFLMYKFVPDYEGKLSQIKNISMQMCLDKKLTLPVYKNDNLFPWYEHNQYMKNFSNENIIPIDSNLINGSWFYRNSSLSTIYVYSKCDYR